MNYTQWIYKEGFTTKLTSYYYILPLSPKSATLGSLLARVLERGSQDYPTVEAIHDRGDELYGATAYFDVNIYGSYLCFEAKLLTPNYLFFDQPELEEEAHSYFQSLLYRPLLEEGKFKENIFLQEKEMLAQDMESLLKDPESYALLRSMELLFPDSNLGIYKYGDRKSLEQLSGRDLIDFYRELMDAPLYIYHHGDEKRNDEGIKHTLEMDTVEVSLQEEKFEEDRDILQSILVKAYRVPWVYGDTMVYPSLVLNHLLGGSGTSLLFKRVREEKGLCYSIYSRYDRYKQLFLIVSGHEKQQHQELLSTIEEVIDSLKKGDFSLEELEETKQDLCIGLGSIPDSQGRHLKDSFIRDLYAEEKDITKRMEEIKKVEKSDVIKAARELSGALDLYVRKA